VAPKARALVDAVAAAESDAEVGRLLSGREVGQGTSPKKGPAKNSADKRLDFGRRSPAARVDAALLGRLVDAVRGRGAQDVGVVPVERLPAQLGMFGSNARPITIDAEHARHILNVHGKAAGETITPRDIAALPDLLQRPRAVIRRGDRGLNFILDARDPSGNPLLVGLEPAKTRQGGYAVTQVSTLFGWEQSARRMAAALQEGTALYLSDEGLARAQELLSTGTTPAQSPESGATTRLAKPAQAKNSVSLVLAQYVQQGVDELDQDKLSPLLRLKYRALPDAFAELGRPEQIRSVFVDLQRHLYLD